MINSSNLIMNCIIKYVAKNTYIFKKQENSIQLFFIKIELN